MKTKTLISQNPYELNNTTKYLSKNKENNVFLDENFDNNYINNSSSNNGKVIVVKKKGELVDTGFNNKAGRIIEKENKGKEIKEPEINKHKSKVTSHEDEEVEEETKEMKDQKRKEKNEEIKQRRLKMLKSKKY